jgi:parvulin-like peptidyl-prolyl isomerase
MSARRVALAGLISSWLWVAGGRAEAPRADAGASDAPSEQEQARRAQVVAKGKGFEITVGTLEDYIGKQPPVLRARYVSADEKKALLNNLVRMELLAHEAEARGFAKSPAVRQTVKDGAAQAMLRSEIDEKITPQSISAQEVADFYAANPSEFNHPAQRRASHILLASEEQAKALLPEAKAADLRNFGELARRHSQDGETKLRGGDLAFFTLAPSEPDSKKVPEPIRKAVFQLKAVGETVERPVAVDGGFSIVRYTGERPERHISLAEADGTIRSRLWRERRQKTVAALIDGLRAKDKPKVFTERVDLIKFDDMDKRPPGFPPEAPPGASPGSSSAAPPAPAR